MKKGFTLAEVLITLAVIGVVAALTIPVLVQKYQKKQLFTQFMKTYNTLSTAMDNAIAEYGEPGDWNWGDSSYDYETGEVTYNYGDKPFQNYILSQMKYVKVCDKFSDCFAKGYTMLNGESGLGYGDDTEYNLDSFLGEYFGGFSAALADGAVFGVDGGRYEIQFLFDTNGKKGPNTFGRDLFMATYRTGSYNNETPGFEFEDYEAESTTNSYGEPEGANCDPDSSNSTGLGCGARLIQEGKMNY